MAEGAAPSGTVATAAPPGRAADPGGRPAGRKRGWWPVLLCLVLCAVFIALGTWQVQRRSWKLKLIAQVNARVQAPLVAAPGPADWPGLTSASAQYRHVEVSGHFLAGHDTLVQASTERGAGHWVLTPLRTSDGWTVLVNRGFLGTPRDGADGAPGARVAGAGPAPVAVLGDARPAAPPVGEVTVAGLLRVTEPSGAFLRHNAPAEGRWYSRDVAAIGATLGLGQNLQLAPYFIDAEAGAPGSRPQPEANTAVAPPVPGNAQAAAAEPIGGMTVIAFYNNHLLYTITWYTLALMSAWGAWRVGRPEDGSAPDGDEDGADERRRGAQNASKSIKAHNQSSEARQRD